MCSNMGRADIAAVAMLHHTYTAELSFSEGSGIVVVVWTARKKVAGKHAVAIVIGYVFGTRMSFYVF